ncbi:hypothetical protein DXG03_005576 [Asterophora parasitica]|uniref:Uncharacterized protein n=1 Tax=Asterophora parasitica TaxID=117018 RepID=A0A9P7G1T2_9AGAR|nr:hypothetical protein DXG03_005576 [Asterophora parasitica]
MSSSGRRKATKRRVVSEDEDGHDRDQTISTAAASSPPGTASLRELSHTVEGDSDFEPDHATQTAPSPEDLFAEPSPSTSRRKKRKAGDGPPPTKRKRVHAEGHPDDDFHVTAASGDDDDDPVEAKRQSKPTAKAKARGGKAKAGDAQDKKAHHGRPQPEASRSAGTKRPRTSSKAEDATVDVVGDLDAEPGTRSPSQPKEPTSPPPKKRKLPKINKNKPVGAASGPTSAKPPLPAADSTQPVVPILPESKTARKTPAMLGNTDFDLRDSSVYRELFKAPSGSNPRGLSRQERDKERRKELDKLRDDARAKRMAEMTVSFNLQAQSEKIELFEEGLRSKKSSAIFPNFLAAKWRELWELDRRKAKDQGQWAGGTTWGESGEREEGEMRS